MMKLMSAAFGLLVVLSGVSGSRPAAALPHNGLPADPDIRYVGRWDKSNPADYHSYWTAPYLRVGFTGRSVKIKLAEGTTLNVGIDGAVPRVVNAGAGETALNSAPLRPGRHTLLVGGAAQNQEVQFEGLTLDPGAATFAVSAQPLIEFIGDSITAGGAGNYAWLTGEALGCDHTQIAFSGVALTSGYGYSRKVGQDTQYFRLKNYNHASDTPPVPWDFSYTPQIVVINLGQNDQCGAEPGAVMTASYTSFLKHLRATYPQTQIVALRTFSGPYAASIQQAAETVRAGGDARVHYIDTTGWLAPTDCRDGVHPNVLGNVKVARRLAPLLWTLLPGAPPHPASMTVGDPAHPEALAQSVQDAYSSGARQIVIHPGVYVLPNAGHTALTLDGWKDAVLSAYGVTLILTDLTWTHEGIDLKSCTHVTVAGPLLSQNKVTSYQGRVIAVGTDAAGKPTCDWKPDAGYPVPTPTEKGFLGGDVNVVDAKTRLLKIGCGDFYGTTYTPLPDGTFRAQMGGHFGVGDWLVGRYGDAPFKIYLNNCRDCTIKNVTLMRNGFAPLREDGGGGNHYLHCVWALGPPPGTATEKPLVTNAADGMHMIGSFPGPDIENCLFQGVFLDDCSAIHGGFQTIKSASGTSLTLDGGVGSVKAGEPVRISDQKGFFAEATVVSVKDNKDKTTTVILDKDYGIPASAKLSNPRADGAGYKIIGCHLGDTRSRGILAKADNGLIENNVLENCGQAAVSLGPEYYWGEADYVQHVTIRNNVIESNGRAGYGGAAILVHGDGAVGNRDIVVQGNQFRANLQGDLDVQWADGVTLAGNVLTAPSVWPAGIKAAPPVRLAHCRDIVLQGNTVQNAASYSSPLVAAGPDVSGIQHNDITGIRTRTAK
jgi:lysophospholipase L1-like esterase